MVENTKQTTVIHFVADGEVREFHFNFQIFEAGDIDVYLDEKLTDTGYNVSVDEEIGGKVIFNQPPANGTRITIIRNLDIKRTSDFQEGGAFRAKVINHELDYQVATLQQLDEKINRSMIYPPYVQGEVSTSLPLPSAGKALVWNQQATALVNSSINVDNTIEEVTSLKNAAQTYALQTQQNAQQVSEYLSQSTEIFQQVSQKAEDVSDCVEVVKQDKEQVKEYVQLASYGNIGDIKYTSRTDVPNGGAWCDGAEYTQTQFPDIYQMLIDNKLQKTDFSTFNNTVSSKGSCGFFALDASAKKFKVPLLKEVYVKLGQTPSMFGAESLPNITGEFAVRFDTDFAKGAFYKKSSGAAATSGAGTGTINGFDVSRSSSTYKSGVKVNPDHVVYRAYVVLFTKSAEVSMAQTQEFMTALGGKINVDLSNIPNNVDFVTESKINSDGSFYRKYKSGWLEQGGSLNTIEGTVTLLKPYKDTKYIVTRLLREDTTQAQLYNKNFSYFNITTTGFNIRNYQETRDSVWLACGQGA